jgi:hypothetical protein
MCWVMYTLENGGWLLSYLEFLSAIPMQMMLIGVGGGRGEA